MISANKNALNLAFVRVVTAQRRIAKYFSSTFFDGHLHEADTQRQAKV